MLSLVSTLLSPAPPTLNRPRAQALDTIHYLRTVMVNQRSLGERFHAIFLGEGCRYLGDESMGQGGMSSLSLGMRELFSKALAEGARAIIIAHSHPSGVCRPSPRDIVETRRLIEVGRALEIELLDHLIITQNGAYSMRAGGDL